MASRRKKHDWIKTSGALALIVSALLVIGGIWLFLHIGGCGFRPSVGKVAETPAVVGSAPAPSVLTGKTVEEIKSQAAVEIARVKAQAEVDSARSAGDARNDFAATVKNWTGWSIGILAIVGVLVFLASFAPFIGSFIDRKAAIYAVLGAGAISMLRYFLLAHGIQAVNIAMWVSIGLLVPTAILVAWPFVSGLIKRAFAKNGEALAVTDQRAGTAIIATAKGLITDSAAHVHARKAILARFVQPQAGVAGV